MYSRVTIVEAMQLLGSFDSSLRDYAIKKLKSADVRIIEKVQTSTMPIKAVHCRFPC